MGVDLGLPHFDGELEELGLLAQTAGLTPVDRVSCKRKAPDAALFIGKGKADEIKLLAAQTGEPVILAPAMGDRTGHPVLWPRPFFKELSQLRGDKGAREIIDRHRNRLRAVPLNDPGIFRDFDQPDAFIS